jgi:HK97 family phage prohead protease
VNKPSREYRAVPFVDMEAAADGSKFTGYAAVFGEVADLGDFTESVQHGAFRKAIRNEPNVPMLWNHNDEHPPLATTRAGTLRLKEDQKGLKVEATIGNHYIADAVKEMVRRDEIAGMSYGFVAGEGNSRLEQRDNKMHRTLIGFNRLLDVSPTHDPAYIGTSAELRNMNSVAVDLQELLAEGEPVSQPDEDEVEDTDTPEPTEEEQEHRARADARWRLAAAQRWLSINTLAERGRSNEE